MIKVEEIRAVIEELKNVKSANRESLFDLGLRLERALLWVDGNDSPMTMRIHENRGGRLGLSVSLGEACGLTFEIDDLQNLFVNTDEGVTGVWDFIAKAERE